MRLYKNTIIEKEQVFVDPRDTQVIELKGGYTVQLRNFLTIHRFNLTDKFILNIIWAIREELGHFMETEPLYIEVTMNDEGDIAFYIVKFVKKEEDTLTVELTESEVHFIRSLLLSYDDNSQSLDERYLELIEKIDFNDEEED